MSAEPVLAVIPARGGSKGLPGKNIRPLAGLPLIVHSIKCAEMTPEIHRVVVSTDSDEIADVAKKNGGAVPFVRPPELATDTAPMLGVLQHAIRKMEEIDGRQYGSLLLLDPTSPGRLPSDVKKALELLRSDPDADGVIGVSVPEFNPLWHCVIDNGGYMSPLIPGADRYGRRQDVPVVYRINATLYLWKRDFLISVKDSWMNGRMKLLEVPESRAIHIDEIEEFERAELMIKNGLVSFPWMNRS